MKASVIVLSWNGVDYLPDCLDSLFKQDYPEFEVLVVDNGSTDGSPDLVETRFPAVKLIRNDRNLGFAAGNNVGLSAATGDVLALLNQDTLVRPNWLTQLVRGIKSDPQIGIGGCKIFYPDERTIQHAGGVIQAPLAFPNHMGYRQPDDGSWDQQREVDFVTGAAMAFHRDLLETIGPLDEGFYPAYYEDADLCARARAAGYTVIYFPHAILIHLESTSIGWNSPTYLQYMHLGRMRYLLKHVSPSPFLEDVVPAERERLRSVNAPEERLALWQAYYSADKQLIELLGTDRFVAASSQEWELARGSVDTALEELREAAFQGAAAPQPPPGDQTELANFHHDRLCSALRHTQPVTLVNEFIPAEYARWVGETPPAQGLLTDLYRQLGPRLRQLLPAAYPGEALLAQASWERLLVNSSIPSSWPVEPNRLASLLRTFEGKGQLQEHVFASSTPIIGSLVARFRRFWYNVAARWAIQTLAQQQETFNSEFLHILGTVERFVIENDRAITQLRRRIAELETRQQSGDGG